MSRRRIKFPGYERMCYGFEQLAENGSDILIDTNCFNPPTGSRKGEKERFKRMGGFFNAFDASMNHYGFTLADRERCKDAIYGIKRMSKHYQTLLKYLIAVNPKVQITIGVESEMQRAVGYMEYVIGSMYRKRKPRGADLDVWRELKHLARDQYDYFLEMVDGDFSPLDMLRRRGLLGMRDTHLHKYVLENRERYGVNGETTGVDEEIVAVAISRSGDGRQTRILSTDFGVVNEVRGFYFDCFSGKSANGFDPEELGKSLSDPDSSVSIHTMGIFGDMRTIQDTYVLYERGFVDPQPMGDFNKAQRKGWKSAKKTKMEKEIEEAKSKENVVI